MGPAAEVGLREFLMAVCATTQGRYQACNERRPNETYPMTIRTSTETITFHRPFCLKGVDRELPPGDYRVVTEEELIEGLSFPAYHRISTVIFVRSSSGSAIEMLTIDPVDLEAARERDIARSR